ncbi:Prolipoprotein diacylglyceryl transferase [Carboxydocella sporoproducens DSM 16521]|uniref:Phosphatidylglycerol--prolipoprotein diacylglyceryl transferase n=2 Tax=Carboxydocella TaxID=178898 RepID=A0A1T4MWP0_9FIRM|nr:MULTISPECIES: prolipoprotein diacylglyceryl transferase [Carboxydocella]AVX20299.1 Prolipoprotein diacylglyceryl transferase [Carboxydocella thermautotrophica]AVX30724.1 Prolipoprotein diacylglyceryl transferase [Carboxydocella thermautotrophica]SJZ71266.1 Prolipoprotein diacylglyceryl transferase [Carboxydocella sporoproducens DSM 16521]
MKIDPIALQIGPLTIRWYGVIMAIAVIIGVTLASREARRQGIDPERILDLALIAAPLSWLGARLYYVIFNWDYYSANPSEIPKIWHGGLAIHGGILTAILVGLWFSRHYRLDFWQLADICAPSLIMGQAIGRWGNFFNQEAYGYETDLPWAMYIDGAYRHPTFLYESLWDLGVFFFLLWIRRKPVIRKGEVFLLYLMAYSVGRFIVESFRTDSLMLGPLRAAQVMSVVLFTSAGLIILWRRKKSAAR